LRPAHLSSINKETVEPALPLGGICFDQKGYAEALLHRLQSRSRVQQRPASVHAIAVAALLNPGQAGMSTFAHPTGAKPPHRMGPEHLNIFPIAPPTFFQRNGKGPLHSPGLIRVNLR